ncbi:hypothetical protein HHK36_026415 [Tetracentron sinense]|uniref:histidine kinase n=1 Tax=Tetracentron sinense TaxID=13715 RepID=A0A834YGV4_TETSI|nr:hypothetical protein HHK36_026415 [Tetracentron sinense]
MRKHMALMIGSNDEEAPTRSRTFSGTTAGEEGPEKVVAVALSHAAILEESMQARDLLMEQNVALDLARREAEMAICARNDFLAVMNHEMRTPIHAIIALSSLLLETELTPEQRVMVETVLKSSNLLATLINDVLDLSRLEDGSLELYIGPFNLHEVFGEVINLIKPIASVKKLSMSLVLAPDLPLWAVGDEKRLMQTILNVACNAVKFTKDGYVTVIASIAKPESLRDWRAPEFYPVSSDGHFHLQVQVKDSGCGINQQDIPHLFTKFVHSQGAPNRRNGGAGLGLAICKRYSKTIKQWFANLMEGQFWIENISRDPVGTALPNRQALFHSIKSLFMKKPLIIVCNKSDLQPLDELSEEDIMKLVMEMKAS